MTISKLLEQEIKKANTNLLELLTEEVDSDWETVCSVIEPQGYSAYIVGWFSALGEYVMIEEYEHETFMKLGVNIGEPTKTSETLYELGGDL